MDRRFLKVLIMALIAGPMIALGVSVSAQPDFGKARPLTISRAADGLHAAPGVRFSTFDADGCAFMSRAVIDEKGRAKTVNDLFCKH